MAGPDVSAAQEGPPSSPLEPRRGEISLFELATPLVRYWKLIVGSAVLVGIGAAVYLLVQQPAFTARTSFTPELPTGGAVASSLAGLAGLAGQLGIAGGQSNTVSPEFFVQLLQSRELLTELLHTEFPDSATSGEHRSRPLIDILEFEGATERERVQKAVLEIRKRIATTTDASTGLVTVSVEMPTAMLAAAVANRLVELLNEFNLERRQSQSGEQRRFTGERLEVAEQELRQAEQAELAFLEANRLFMQSPVLTARAARLQREVQVRQQVYLTLVQAHEEARISEVRDTPVLTVVDSAVAPFRRSSPRRTLGVLVAFVAGTAAGIVLAYLAAARARVRRAPSPDYIQLREAWSETRRPSGRS